MHFGRRGRLRDGLHAEEAPRLAFPTPMSLKQRVLDLAKAGSAKVQEEAASTLASFDAVVATFSVDPKGVVWPLTLTVGMNVTRADEGPPSVFLSFFAEQAPPLTTCAHSPSGCRPARRRGPGAPPPRTPPSRARRRACRPTRARAAGGYMRDFLPNAVS